MKFGVQPEWKRLVVILLVKDTHGEVYSRYAVNVKRGQFVVSCPLFDVKSDEEVLAVNGSSKRTVLSFLRFILVSLHPAHVWQLLACALFQAAAGYVWSSPEAACPERSAVDFFHQMDIVDP